MPTSSQVGASTTLTVTYELSQTFPEDGFIVLQTPYLDAHYEVDGSTTGTTCMFTGSTSATVSDGSTYSTAETVTSGVTPDASALDPDPTGDYCQIALLVDNGSDISGGTTLSIVLSNVGMPFSTKPLESFVLYTAASDGTSIGGLVETAADGTAAGAANASLTMTSAGAASGTVDIGDNDSSGATGAKYSFTFTAGSPIPKEDGYLVI